MIKVEHIEVMNWEAAIRGMRNPMNSWAKSDSKWCYDKRPDASACNNLCCDDCVHPKYEVGENDMGLMQRLCKGGSVHRKFMRMIFVSMDITAPLYWWKEFDTYKVGTVANSCSTMHKIHAKPFTMDDFSHEHLPLTYQRNVLEFVIHALNIEREQFIETKDKDHWWNMIQLLPSSYNQKRTVTFSYENVAEFIKWRTNHKLDEWTEFCCELLKLPYLGEIMRR